MPGGESCAFSRQEKLDSFFGRGENQKGSVSDGDSRFLSDEFVGNADRKAIGDHRVRQFIFQSTKGNALRLFPQRKQRQPAGVNLFESVRPIFGNL